jgi:DNA polymerase III delta prime subunit
MNFQQRNTPTTVQELVFHDPTVAQIIDDYASGKRSKHLLLEGPTSSGKTEAARMILHERLTPHFGAGYTSIHHGQGFDHHTTKQIEGDWNVQMMYNAAYSIIDEIDFANPDGRREIRKLIDQKSYGTLICTTNHISKLEPAFASRFLVVTVDVPAARDWHNRALNILTAEGHAVSLGQVQKLMANFSGHARDFIDEVENVHLSLMRARATSQSQSGSAGQPKSVVTNAKPRVVSNGIMLPRGSALKAATPRSNGKSQQ